MPIYEKLPYGGGTVMGIYPEDLKEKPKKNPFHELMEHFEKASRVRL